MWLCFQAHKKQIDKGGMPYVFHPFHVAEQMPDEICTVVALLHDVVEDSPYTLEDIKNRGFPREVIDALLLLTHDLAIPYMEYVARIKTNPIAKTVKLADLAHNCDTSRLNATDDKALKRIEKYKAAIALLKS